MKVYVVKRSVSCEKWMKHNYTNADIKVVYCGYLELEDPMNDDIWDWCNWSCWSRGRKPTECKHLNISFCNSDVAYCINGIWYSHTMEKFTNFNECYKELCKEGSEYFDALWPHTSGFRTEDESKLTYITPLNISTIITY